MGLFRRSGRAQSAFDQGGGAQVPPEVSAAVAELIATQDFSFFTPAEWQRFTGAVAASVKRVGVPDADYRGQGYVVAPSIGYIFLDNISRACHDAPPAEWDRMLDQFFAGAASPRPDIGEVSDLRVRLVSESMDPTTLARDWAPTLIEELCFEFEHAIVGVSPEELKTLEIDADAAFAVARRQTLDAISPEGGQRFTTGEEPKQTLFTYEFGESLFVSSLVLDLPRAVGDLGPAGALFGIPSRTGFCVHRIGVDAPLTSALSVMLQFIIGTHDDALRPGSRELFWWVDGRVTWLPTITDTSGLPVLDPASESVRTFQLNHHG